MACAFFVPLRSLDCPSWDVWVADPTGNPVAGAKVRLSCRNYSAESESHELDQTTDVRGHAAFPARTIRASLGDRIAATLLSASEGVHASFGRHASVFAFGNGRQGFDVDTQKNVVREWTGTPSHLESRITLK
jgi:hypothetical protein